MYLRRPRRMGNSYGAAGNRSVSGFGVSQGGGLSSNSPTNPQGFPQNGDIILTGSEPPKRKKKLIVLISAVCFVVVLVLGIVLVSNLNTAKKTPRLEVYDALFDFYKGTYNPSSKLIEGSYQYLLEWYDLYVGFVPHLALPEESAIFPIQVSDYSIDWFERETTAIEDGYEYLSTIIPGGFSDEESKLFSLIKTGTPLVLAEVKTNMAKLFKVYDVYIAPIMQAYQGGRPAVCQKNEKMLELTDDPTMSVTAEKYYSLYCEATKLYDEGKNIEELTAQVRPLAIEATTVLNEMLGTVDTGSVDAIDKLMQELERGE